MRDSSGCAAGLRNKDAARLGSAWRRVVERQIIRRDPPQHETSRLQPVGAVRRSLCRRLHGMRSQSGSPAVKRRRAPSTRPWPGCEHEKVARAAEHEPGATPTLAMTRPARGPTIRAPLNAAELSATALTTSSDHRLFTERLPHHVEERVPAAHSARTPTCQYATTPSHSARRDAVHASPPCRDEQAAFGHASAMAPGRASTVSGPSAAW